MRTLPLAIIFLLLGHLSQAQGVSNVYVFPFSIKGDTSFIYGQPTLVSHLNKKGYNNQPFWNGNTLYMTVQNEGGSQTDIYSFDFSTRTRTQLTRTSTAEYSPTLMPDGKHLSMVVVEPDNAQRLWAIPLDGDQSKIKCLLPNIKNVGYHEWLSPTEVALFLVGENPNPHQLYIADTKTGVANFASSNIGRCMKMGRTKLTFVSKRSDNDWHISQIYPQRSTYKRQIASTLVGSEDFVFIDEETLIMARGAKLYRLKLDQSQRWELIGDLSRFGITNISRLAYNNNRLALVDNEKSE